MKIKDGIVLIIAFYIACASATLIGFIVLLLSEYSNSIPKDKLIEYIKVSLILGLYGACMGFGMWITSKKEDN